MKILTVGLTGLLLASFVLGIGALMGAGVAWLYNVALAEPFGWPALTWWQGWAVLFLTGLLFRGTRGRGAR